MRAEVLEADGFDAFTEAGDSFHGETVERLLRHVYSAGGKRKPSRLSAMRARLGAARALAGGYGPAARALLRDCRGR